MTGTSTFLTVGFLGMAAGLITKVATQKMAEANNANPYALLVGFSLPVMIGGSLGAWKLSNDETLGWTWIIGVVTGEVVAGIYESTQK